MSAALLLSGGLDSTALLARDPAGVRLCVACDYGQRHVRELTSAVAVARHYGKPLRVLRLRGIFPDGSALIGRTLNVPHGHYTDDSMHITVVPNRNLLMLTAAAGFAARAGCRRILFAAHAGDHAIYPDCRPEFVRAADAVLLASCGVRVEAPFQWATKAEIVSSGLRNRAPFHLTWSCYEGGSRHCGKCGTCVERREAFVLAGVEDPTDYAA